ncbi:nitroreductase family protein [Pannonibacter sp. I15F10I1]|uniref:nitroreductase family protein n=1 Tax=Pannonibacter sp. I15F10I1 TaxID=2003580 RepID=UPI00164950D2|nr:nitroreductase family protein [Pannonibacter sp. I15F10I1]
MRKLKMILPRDLKHLYRTIRAAMFLFIFSSYDLYRFFRSSSAFRVRKTIAQADALITMQYHTIEKGLALKQPRPGFGIVVVERLADALHDRIVKKLEWTSACSNGLSALIAYQKFNDDSGVERNQSIERTIEAAQDRNIEAKEDATKIVHRQDILDCTNFDAEEFFWSRHSVRQFESGGLDMQRFLEALDLGRSAPSVCNRQTARVRYVINQGGNLGFLELQNGNRGFGSTAQAILIITSELSNFVDPAERYQGWIDGGMFAMTTLLGLHAKGFGACCLNWSQTHTADLELRKRLKLPPTETVIMLIAVGNMPNEFPVAQSSRLPANDIIVRVEPTH